jgi:hypothetical protein
MLMALIKVSSGCNRYITLVLLLLVQVSQPRPNETTVFDGTAIFSRWNNDQYQETQVAVTIHRMEVFRMEFTYDSQRFVILYFLFFCYHLIKFTVMLNEVL